MAKLNLSYQQILEHLEVIDNHLHLPYKEFIIPTQGHTSITDIALGMMLHVGLIGYEPIIKYEKLDSGTAGHICLNNNPDRKVYITLSNNPDVERDSLIATLAHEICHKLLFSHNCYFPLMTDYNEALTDLTTIYAGFGKHTLNGCEISKSRTDTLYTTQGTQTRTTTTTHYTGYLDYNQYKTAYDIVCDINSISYYDKYYGVKHEHPSLSESDIIEREIEERFNDFKKNILSSDARSMNLLLQIESFVSKLKQNIKTRQQKYIKLISEVQNTNGKITNPYKAKLLMSMQFQAQNLSWYGEEQTAKMLEPLRYAIDKIKANNPEYHNIVDITLNIECPCCGYKRQNTLAVHKELLIKCPKCNSVFYWNAIDENNTYLAELKKKEKEHKQKESNKAITNRKNILTIKDRIISWFSR